MQGCAVMTGPGKAAVHEKPKIPDLVWPPAPAAPRIRYVGELTGRKDFAAKRSFLGRIFAFLLGVRSDDNFFTKPLAVHIDYNDNICVADPGTKGVFVFDHDRSAFQCYRRFGKTALVSPVSVVGTGTRGTFFVADSALGLVFAADLKGRLLFTLSEGLERPVSLAVFGNSLFVADSKQNQIFVFDFQGNKIRQFGEPGRGPGQFNYPTHITTDNDGRLFVTDTMNFRVQIFDSNGQFLGIVGKQGDTSGGFSRPKGVGVDSLGHVYVADGLFDNIQVFDETGGFLLDWGKAGSQPGEFWLPSGITVSKSNTIYVADSYNKRVQVFQYVGQE